VENYSALEYPDDRMRKLYDINVHGAFYTAREAARLMEPRGQGSIILIASMSAHIVNIPQLQMPYNASKAAVKHMASTLAVEWAKSGIRVNSLSPGYMLTKLTQTVLAGDPHLKVRDIDTFTLYHN
jgi:NAD(P)-dependent dehydrogenase (short-subunit alcohol dehydrogenase family)